MQCSTSGFEICFTLRWLNYIIRAVLIYGSICKFRFGRHVLAISSLKYASLLEKNTYLMG